MRQLNRIAPKMPAQAYKTFSVSSPLSTHFRRGTCAEAGCGAHRFGWRTVVNEALELGQRQAHYIRKESGRKFTERRSDVVDTLLSGIEAGMTVFEFEAGQRCFTRHQVPVGRPELYVVREGDWRGNPRGADPRLHTKPEHWVEDMAGLLDKLKTAQEQG